MAGTSGLGRAAHEEIREMNGNGYQPRTISSGSSGDLFAAYISRAIVIAALSYIAYISTQSKEGVQDLKRDATELKSQAVERDRKIQEIQDSMKKFATKEEMNAAEERIQKAFAEQLKKQTPILTGNDHGQHYEK